MAYDIFYVSKHIINEHDWEQFRMRFPSAQKINNVKSFSDVKKKAFTKLFWIVWDDLEIVENFDFSYRVPEWDQDFIHVWLNNTIYDGVGLFSKDAALSEKEFEHRFYVNKKEIEVVASIPKKFEIFNIDSYDEYLNAINVSNTGMFWIVFNDIIIEDSFKFDTYISHHDFYNRNENHLFLNNTAYDGLILASKNKLISKKEFDHRFLIDKKEWNIVASKPKQYDQYIISNHDDYLEALNSSHTEMFWGIWSNVSVTNQKIFDTYFSHHDKQSRTENHVFKNACNNQISFVNGVVLFSKNTPVSKKEIEHRFLINKKEYDIVASQSRYPKYIISNYNEYLNICQTEKQPLFWCVWPDIEIIDNTIFDFYFDPFDGQYDYDRSVNHMFKNKVGNEKSYISGVALCSPKKVVSKKEIEHRFFLDKKENQFQFHFYLQ
jgi:hypothetical protein